MEAAGGRSGAATISSEAGFGRFSGVASGNSGGSTTMSSEASSDSPPSPAETSSCEDSSEASPPALDPLPRINPVALRDYLRYGIGLGVLRPEYIGFRARAGVYRMA